MGSTYQLTRNLIHVPLAAYLMGLAAAAPMGPVNMLAISRGMIGGWRRTLACAIGSVSSDLTVFSLVVELVIPGHFPTGGCCPLGGVAAITQLFIQRRSGVYYSPGEN
jgi:hypothetical protein